MTNAEFSNQFDVLYNNIMSNQAPGLDEYEKSVFLTKAQNEITLAYFNPKGNKYLEGFDGNERRQIDFSMLMRVVTDSSPVLGGYYDTRTTGVYTVALPTDILLFVNENAVVTRGGKTLMLTVVPLNYLEYSRLMSKPFKRPIQYQAWRIINGKVFEEQQSVNSGNQSVPGETEESTGDDTELASVVIKSDLIVGAGDTLTKYVVRYIKRPNPIILTDLTAENLSIDNQTAVSECELDPIIHQDILQRAVELAKAAYTGDLTSQVSIGSNSATDKGYVSQSKDR